MKTIKYFAHCETLESLKAEYKRLAKIHHPDAGGDDVTMAEINAEFDEMHNRLSSGARTASSASSKRSSSTIDVDAAAASQAEAAAFRDAVMAVINLPGLFVELCGSWIWVSGDTYQHRQALKSAGYRWSKNKARWYWRSEDAASYHRGKSQTMEYIRDKYGNAILAENGRDPKRRPYAIAD